MVRRIMDAYQNKDALDEKEFIGNIRLKLPGELLSLLFEELFKSWINEVKKMSEKKRAMWAKQKQDKYGHDIIFRMTDFLNHGDIITHGLELTLKTGNFNVKRFKMERTGVTQVLQRSSYVSALAHMTEVFKQSEKSRNVSGAKAMHYSQFGMLCPCDIRVEACGVVRSLALMTHVTTDVEKDCSIDIIRSSVQRITTLKGIHLHEPDSFLVIYNGVILGRHENPQVYANYIRDARRSGRVSKFLSVHVNEKQCCVYLASDGGRVCRPLVIVEKGISKIKDIHMAELKEGKRTFDSFVNDALVEYVDVNEANNALIALTEQDVSLETTHIELEPFSILGVSAGIIPYPHHNHSRGNFKQCAVGKKAIGNITYNQLLRMDRLLNSLVYPQRPLLTTKSIELVGYDKIGGGQNAIIAVMSFSGYDTNDAIVMNKSSIDRGFGRSTIMKTDTIIKQNYNNCTSDRFRPPTRDNAGRMQH
ncbi:unnamed protein product [Vicia faba]|uniref:DNA-directed RNA polymerase n=1 Tax=Vicia faba TaxID=3906 RepID=A0AAV1AA63_VICFA|nr:unnamed protein product [Vicia faba]